MTSPDSDDEPDDPALHSMRAVWLSMRDEDPPSAGLSALLAAARAKADEMKPPEPWWRRSLALLRRPPVLALATVVVLLGGAVLISSRRDEMDATPHAAQSERASAATLQSEALEKEGAIAPPPSELPKDFASAPADPAKGDSPSTEAHSGVANPSGGAAPGAPASFRNTKAIVTASGSGSAAPGGGAAGTAGATAGARPPAPTGAPETKNEAAVVAEPAAVPPPAPPPPPPPPPVTTGRQVDSAGAPAPSTLDQSGGAVEKVKSPPPSVTISAPTKAPKTVTRPAPKQDLQIAGDADAVSEVQVTGTAPGVKNAGAVEDRGEGKATRGPTLEQLAKQAETAAARGDCAAVRAIVSRIRKLDATFHKERIQNNAAVKRCVK